MKFLSLIETPLGTLTAISDERALHFLGLKNRFLASSSLPQDSCFHSLLTSRQCSLVPNKNLEETPCQISDSSDYFGIGNPPPIQQIQQELDCYFSGEKVHFQTPLHFNGTPFQNRVWSQLRTIECGQTQSYGEIAKGINHPKASRAIGGAVKRNPFLIIIPCHRVIRTGGALGGFNAGIERKKWLLKFEGR